jgi:hypothetical protein
VVEARGLCRALSVKGIMLRPIRRRGYMTMNYPISGHPESIYQEINEGVNRHLNGKTPFHRAEQLILLTFATLNLLRVVTRSPTRASNSSVGQSGGPRAFPPPPQPGIDRSIQRKHQSAQYDLDAVGEECGIEHRQEPV